MSGHQQAISPLRSLLRRWLDAAPWRRHALALLTAAPEPVYLVGGSVRDALLGRDSYDLDVAVAGSAMALGRRLADALGGAFVPMDAAHDVARVVLRQGAVYHHIDLAGLRAADILQDLQERDFTINAMAVALQPTLGDILDPTGGQCDLAAQTLRAVYANAFCHDPLRILRGVRLAGALALRWTSDTEALARGALALLVAVSGERIRDELFNILALPHAAAALGYSLAEDALRAAAPAWEGAAFAPALGALATLEERFPRGQGGPPWRWLERFREAMHDYWRYELSVGRDRLALLKLALLLAEAPGGGAAARRLRLSRHETAHLAAMVRASQHDLALATETPLAPLDLHRYYRAAGEAGVNGVMLALSHRLTSPLPKDSAAAALRRAEALLQAWFEQHETLVDPSPLLSGTEIVAALGVAPGPQVGRLLAALREAQVSGVVEDAEQARRFLRRLLAGE
jgi:tRNA nucleotidyltransferase/poly(A) polymerase